MTNPDVPSWFSENHRNMRQDKRFRMYWDSPNIFNGLRQVQSDLWLTQY